MDKNVGTVCVHGKKQRRNVDNTDFFETKVGIVINLEDNKIKIKEIDKYGNFYKNSEIYFDEIQLLAVKNYRLGV